MNEAAGQTQAAVAEAVAVVRGRWADRPLAAMILGTGLGSLADHIRIEAEWEFDALPHFARSTADGHRGRLICGRLNGVPVVAMDGRFHAYEGYSPQQITFPVRVLSALGTRLLVISNASGGLNPSLNSGDILQIDDHINLLWADPLRGLLSSIGPRGMQTRSPFYDEKLMARVAAIASDEGISLCRGTYIAMLGPNYETRAEYRWLQTIGDVVGMSTVPEVEVARDLSLPTIAFSMVTNVFRPDDVQQTTSEEVIAAAAGAEPKLRRLVERLLVDVAESMESVQ